MQIYRMMEIGTAKPSHEECRRVPHHMIDIADPDEAFDAARFAEKAREIIFDLHQRGVVPFVAGGTGLYIKALVHGLFQADPPDAETRRQIMTEIANLGSAALHNRLTQVDPEMAERIHPNDRFRIVRALEMHAVSGVPLSEHHREHGFRDSPFRVLNIGLTMDREALYARIDRRVDAMIAAGLEDEVSWLLKSGYSKELKSMQSIGYRHMIAHLSGHMSREDALQTMKRDTRRYAKRQMTWFRAVADIVWIEPGRIENLYPQIEAFLK
jgi:tRNA dimethylallyltransferase